MAFGSHHSLDGAIQTGDVVVSRVNGTRDFYIIATVASAAEDLALDSVLTAKGQDTAISRAFRQGTEDRQVWLFAGSAAACVKVRRPKN